MENVAASSNTTKAKPKSTLSPDDYLNLLITNSSLGISKSSWGTLHPLLKSLQLQVFMYRSVQNTENDFLSEKLQEKYDVLKYLGAGGYGEVRLVSDKINGRLYAVKKIKKNSSAWTEIQILQSVKHPYIVSFVDSDETNDAIFIIMEYMEEGDLEGLLKESRLYERHFKYIFLQVLMAVEHLHRQRIIHRDLKPSNILRTSDVNDHIFKISDFGLGKIFDDNSIAHTRCGTRSYMAPEMLYNRVGYDYSADVWSMGVLLCYMITSQLPTIKEDKLTGRVEVNIPLLMNVSSDCKNLIRSMLKTNPKERITIQEILQHSWISKDEEVLRKVRLPLDENDS